MTCDKTYDNAKNTHFEHDNWLQELIRWRHIDPFFYDYLFFCLLLYNLCDEVFGKKKRIMLNFLMVSIIPVLIWSPIPSQSFFIPQILVFPLTPVRVSEWNQTISDVNKCPIISNLTFLEKKGKRRENP